jgi:urease accessory protein
MPLPLSQYLQIADSAFPTGAFAYSSGLEALARAGRFPSMRALEEYFDAHLRQAGTFDLAFVAAAHAAHDPAAFEALCAEWDATLWNTAMRTASLRQARAFLDALGDTFPHAGIEALRMQRARAEAATAAVDAHTARAETIHFALVLGRALALLGASREQTCCLYLHGIIRDQAAAAVRLGLVGPRAGQELQARAMRGATERLGDASALPAPHAARRTAPLVETGQGGHDFLYSRLFQN